MYDKKLRIAVCGRKEQVGNYLDAISHLGGESVHVEDDIDPSEFDGLLLPGGVDISPVRYHEANEGSVRVDEELDEWQFTALKKFVDLKKPVFGICRGHQLINVFFGGSLIQHIDCANLHARDAGSDQDKVHINFAEAGSYIANLYGTQFYTNSSHHQVVDRLGEGLRIVQRSGQGLVGAMCHESLPIWSVQWHPERMCFRFRRDDTVDGSAVLKWFLDNCARLKTAAGEEVRRKNMKRSEVNDAIRWAEALLEKNNVHLPEYAGWDVETWKKNADKLDTIKRVMLGWDISDFGTGNFAEVGAVLYTMRNGSMEDAKLGVPYCEKYILMKEGQRLPKHYHVFKTEDIINRANGVLAVYLWNADEAGNELDTDVSVFMDGVERTFKAGEEILVYPGNSISLKPYVAHIFGPKPGMGDLVVGEVSKVNDDNTDNYFLEPTARFSDIEEDEVPLHPLCNEYGKIIG